MAAPIEVHIPIRFRGEKYILHIEGNPYIHARRLGARTVLLPDSHRTLLALLSEESPWGEPTRG